MIRVSMVLLLAALLVLSVSCISSQEETESVGEALTQAEEVTEIGHKTVVYYFHGHRRCANCVKIENYTTEAVQTAFAEQIANGRVELVIVNTDESENQHFNEDYELYTKSVVLVNRLDGEQVRWKNLPDIWNLLDNKEGFVAYVTQEVTYFLEDV